MLAKPPAASSAKYFPPGICDQSLTKVTLNVSLQLAWLPIHMETEQTAKMKRHANTLLLKAFQCLQSVLHREGLRVAYNRPIVLPQSLPDHSPEGRAPLLLMIREPEREQGFFLPCQPFTAVDFPEHRWPLASRWLAHLSANIPFVLRTMLPSFLPCFARPFVPLARCTVPSVPVQSIPLSWRGCCHPSEPAVHNLLLLAGSRRVM